MLSTDPEYVAYQYVDSEKLRIRIETHQRYTVGEGDFQATELKHLQVRAGQRLLDVGCGHGRLAGLLRSRGVSVVGLDRSGGLLRETQATVASSTWVRGGAIALPFREGQFERAVALGVLYHVRDWPRALEEMRHVARRVFHTYVIDGVRWTVRGIAGRSWLMEPTQEEFNPTQQNHQHAERDQGRAGAGISGMPGDNKTDECRTPARDDDARTTRADRQLGFHAFLALGVVIERIRDAGRKHFDCWALPAERLRHSACHT